MLDMSYRVRSSVASYRVRNLLIAAALAACAVALMFVYASHAKSSATPAAGNAQVYVAARDIPIGTTGAQLASGGWLVERKFAGNSVASGAVASTAALNNLVAIQPTYAGEQIVARRFGTAQQEGLLSDLKGTARVMELPGDAHQLLAGTLKQGNRVDVIGNVTIPEGSQTHSTVIALRNLLVLKAPSSPSSSATGQVLSVDLKVTGKQAQRLYWLQKNGDWSLLLRPSVHATDPSSTPASATAILDGSNGR
jgi:pilus assembly protein CpaB